MSKCIACRGGSCVQHGPTPSAQFFAALEGDAVPMAMDPRHIKTEDGWIDLRDPRDTEIAALRAQLADAVKVVDAARDVMAAWDDTKVDDFDLGRRENALVTALAAYDAKHKEPAK